MRSVINSLGFSSAYAVVGSSQGAAAGFNALSQCPTLSGNLVCMHPISTSSTLDKYKNIMSPCLLVYDTSDPGHPVSVGRQVLRVMKENGMPRMYVEIDNGKYEGEEAS